MVITAAAFVLLCGGAALGGLVLLGLFLLLRLLFAVRMLGLFAAVAAVLFLAYCRRKEDPCPTAKKRLTIMTIIVNHSGHNG